jgi:hypothetical protein
MGKNNGVLRDYIGCIFFGASWAVIFLGKIHQKKALSF